jgi:hypothetical protein
MAIGVIIRIPYECMHKSWPQPNPHYSIQGKVEIIIRVAAAVAVILLKYRPLLFGNNPTPHPNYLPDRPMDIGDSGIRLPILHKNLNAL